MKKKQGSKVNAGFFKGLRIYVGIALILNFVVIGALWMSLSKYQARLNGNVGEDKVGLVEDVNSDSDNSDDTELAIQQGFLDYANELGLDDWVKIYYVNHPERFDKEDDVKSFINDRILGSDYSFYKSADYTLDAPIYVMASDSEVLATFYMVKAGDGYSVGDVELNINGENEATISAPESCMITINGAAIDEPSENVIIENGADIFSDYASELTNKARLKSYVITGLISDENELVATDAQRAADGNYFEVISDENKADKALAFVKALLHYYAMGKEETDANMGAVLGLVASGSKASEIIAASNSGVIWRIPDHAVSYSFEVSPVYKLADNSCFVDVTYKVENAGSVYDDLSDGIYRVFYLNDKIVEFSGMAVSDNEQEEKEEE